MKSAAESSEMKIYSLVATLIFLIAYSVFHFGFRESGAEHLYRINDKLAFQVQPENENYNGITVHGFKPANKFIALICGACQRDDSRTFMVNVKYRKGDWVYTDFPQHLQALTDIINLRTGETIEADVPADFKFGDDWSKLPEYSERGLIKSDEYKLTQDYVKANFKQLSTFTDRCVLSHVIFGTVALFVAFPQTLVWLVELFVRANDPTDPMNYYG